MGRFDLMPFDYYGAKHGLAPHYGPPAGRVLVEPFAGSAGYACRWADRLDRVILNDLDPAVVELWHRVQQLTTADLDRLELEVLTAERTTDPLIAAPGGSTSLLATLSGKSRAITPRMRADWPKVRRRIERALPFVRTWEIRHGSYEELEPIHATWFVDPPYQAPDTAGPSESGNAYRHGQTGIDFQQLGEWCRQLPGLVIVCEQEPAAWLPFWQFREQKNAQNQIRTELVWRSDYQQLSIFEPVT